MISGKYSEDEFKKMWSKICYYPKPTKSRFLEIGQGNDIATISTTWSRFNLVTKKSDCHEIITTINFKTGKIAESQACVTKTPLSEARSHDGLLMAKVFADTIQMKPVYYIENTLKHQISLADQSLHERLYGKSSSIYSDGSFASIVWSTDCTKLYYLAETHKQDSKSFELVEHFGEKFTDVFKPQIFSLEIETQTISKAVDLPDHFYPSKVRRYCDSYFTIIKIYISWPPDFLI
ncbi:hypothetical protein RF11_06458 [Thelohanellus kitauei]|uniref:Uncharacterized protein n=1 Tax=Thelohanellus kitauei TaxID=669202 RepID=A0A0C2MZ97_THEKT|nr:hypothetical protein RF11_06458 [Thelohanellus kitauei]